MKERKSAIHQVVNGPGQSVGSWTMNLVFTTHLVWWLSWVFATKERKNERREWAKKGEEKENRDVLLGPKWIIGSSPPFWNSD